MSLQTQNTFYLALIVVVAVQLIGCSDKPVNLSVARESVKEYYETGKFDEELDNVIREAKNKFSKVEFTENLVVIFDVDETVLDNYELAKSMGFGYVYEMNKKWNKELKAPAIPQVFDTLIAQREHEYKLSATEFKSSKRVELIEMGYEIIGTVGDQWSDLDGPHHGIQVKIPNYLYQIVD